MIANSPVAQAGTAGRNAAVDAVSTADGALSAQRGRARQIQTKQAALDGEIQGLRTIRVKDELLAATRR